MNAPNAPHRFALESRGTTVVPRVAAAMIEVIVVTATAVMVSNGGATR
jgi:hypothetical protein